MEHYFCQIIDHSDQLTYFHKKFSLIALHKRSKRRGSFHSVCKKCHIATHLKNRFGGTAQRGLRMKTSFFSKKTMIPVVIRSLPYKVDAI